MAVSMEDVRAVLDPEEPDYGAVAALGEEAMPHLERLVRGDDHLLASKAAYAAGLVGGPRAAATIHEAASSDDATVRVAAAAAAANLDPGDASDLLEALVADTDPGVRKVARSSVPEAASPRLTARLAELPDEWGRDTSPLDPLTVQGLMPGEQASGATMPGEATGLMPGESAGEMR